MRPDDTTGEPGRNFPTAMKTTNKTLFVVLPLAAAVNAAWAQAASDEDTTLDTSVVSASGYSQDVREAPASVSVIPAQELQTKPVRDLGTAIGFKRKRNLKRRR